jgi:hypothetical protein
LLRDPKTLRNQLHYFTGLPTSAPRIVGLAKRDSLAFRRWLAGRLAAGDTVYTDALGGYQPFDRARLTQGNQAARLLAGQLAERVDSFATLSGPRYLTRLAAPHLLRLPSIRAASTTEAGRRGLANDPTGAQQ